MIDGMGFWQHFHPPAFSCSSSGKSLGEADFHLHQCHHAKLDLISHDRPLWRWL
jgi:hypothetical protein